MAKNAHIQHLLKFVLRLAIRLVAAVFILLPLDPARAATLVYANYGDIKEWDPAAAFSIEAILLYNVYEPLIWYNKPGGQAHSAPVWRYPGLRATTS